jgi:hypothetical protein
MQVNDGPNKTRTREDDEDGCVSCVFYVLCCSIRCCVLGVFIYENTEILPCPQNAL